MKKILYALVLVVLAITETSVNAKNAQPYYINNNGIEMSEKNYNNLKGLGFTDQQIAKMNNETFSKKKDIEATVVAQNVKHYVKVSYLQNGLPKERYEVVTENEYQGRLINPGNLLRSVSGSYYNGMAANDQLAIVTTISNIDDDYMQYRLDVYNYYIPTNRSFDIYGIGIENGKVQVASAIECEQSWNYSSGSSDSTIGCYAKSQTTGGSAMFELPSGNISNLETYISFWVAKYPDTGTVTYLEAAGDYAHAINTVSDAVFNYYNVTTNGIGVYSPYSTSYEKYFEPASGAHFMGTW